MKMPFTAILLLLAAMPELLPAQAGGQRRPAPNDHDHKLVPGFPLANPNPKSPVLGFHLPGGQPAKMAIGQPLPPQQQLRHGKPAKTVPGQPLPPGAYAVGPYQTPYFLPNSPDALQPKVNAKLQEYKSQQDSDKRKEIESELKGLLNEQFDERLKAPVSRIEQSQKRLDAIRKKIDNRSENSEAMIDLRLKVLINQATGLGWDVTPRTVVGRPLRYTAGGYYGALGGSTGRQPFNVSPGGPATVQGFPGSAAPGSAASAMGIAPLPPNSQSAGVNIQKQSNLNAASDKPTIGTLLADYQEAEDDSTRAGIRKELRELLKAEFQQYQDQLANSVSRIEDQIAKLKSNIDQRREMKDSIVNLKLKTLINQANGLGF